MIPKVPVQIKLGKGCVYLYDFGKIKMHAFMSNDPLNDVSFMLEKDGLGLVLEPQCFSKSVREFEKYIKKCDVGILGLVVGYHYSGGKFLPNVKRYGSRSAKFVGTTHGSRTIMGWLARLFRNDFDNSTNFIDYYVDDGQKITIGGIQVIALKTKEGLDLVFPEIKTMYVHVFGANTHSILYSMEHIAETIENWKNSVGKRYSYIISSHGLLEDSRNIRKKVAYLKALRKVAHKSRSAKDFKKTMMKRYPDYDGREYLDMTSRLLFNNKSAETTAEK